VISSKGVARFVARTLPPAVLGAVTLFAYAPFSFWPLMLLSLGLLFGLVEVAATPREAALAGWGFGLGFFLAATHWIYISLHDFGGLPMVPTVLAIAALSAFLALYPALAMWAARRIAGEHRAALHLLALPACWLLSEWLRGWLLTGFPWSSIGYTQIPDGPLAGFAPVLGIYGVGGLLAAMAGALAWLLGRRVSRASLAALVGAGLLVGLGLLLGRIEWTHPIGKPLRISLLQGAIPQSEKWGDEVLVFNLRTYQQMIHEARGDLLVLPETAFPVFLHEAPGYYTDEKRGRASEKRFSVLGDDFIDGLVQDAQGKGAAIIAGVPRFTRDGAHYLNAAVLLTDARRPSYYKAHLVPFGEFVPLRGLIGWIYSILDMPLDDFSAGATNQAPLLVKDQRIAANICYEDIFGEELLANARGATMLLNLSNLAWFDGSVALAQHGQIAQARSLETGRPSMLATNSGTTAVVDPHGQYRTRLPERVQGILQSTIQGYEGTTPYLIWGNKAALALAAMAALLAGWMRRR
jgi:apolipoprotein N-acyltransferase